MIHLNEILVILAVILLIFGTGKFPKIMQNLAEGIKSFKKAMSEKDKKDEKKKTTKKTSPSKSSVKKKKNTTTKKKK